MAVDDLVVLAQKFNASKDKRNNARKERDDAQKVLDTKSAALAEQDKLVALDYQKMKEVLDSQAGVDSNNEGRVRTS